MGNDQYREAITTPILSWDAGCESPVATPTRQYPLCSTADRTHLDLRNVEQVYRRRRGNYDLFTADTSWRTHPIGRVKSVRLSL